MKACGRPKIPQEATVDYAAYYDIVVAIFFGKSGAAYRNLSGFRKLTAYLARFRFFEIAYFGANADGVGAAIVLSVRSDPDTRRMAHRAPRYAEPDRGG